jgi:hypothetical protein
LKKRGPEDATPFDLAKVQEDITGCPKWILDRYRYGLLTVFFDTNRREYRTRVDQEQKMHGLANQLQVGNNQLQDWRDKTAKMFSDIIAQV